MRAIVFITGGILLALSIALTARSSRELARVDRTYHLSGDPLINVPLPDKLTPEMAGRAFRLSSGDQLDSVAVENHAREIAARRHKDAAWIRAFLTGYTNASKELNH
jgi:hypothetical protein